LLTTDFIMTGWYEDLTFHVTAMGHPPAESSETSRAFLGTINMFGGPLEITPKSSKGNTLRISELVL
jgi:hypothetical protein